MNVKVYTTHWCGPCKFAKRLLDSKGISYEEIDIEKEGMTREEAIEMNDICIKMAEEHFESLKVWGTLPREHFLLYLDKFGKEALNGKQPPAEEEEKVLCRA